MEDFTFEDFVALLGGDCIADPAEVLEAWEDFLANRAMEVDNG